MQEKVGGKNNTSVGVDVLGGLSDISVLEIM